MTQESIVHKNDAVPESWAGKRTDLTLDDCHEGPNVILEY